jgi:hypothetical protein
MVKMWTGARATILGKMCTGAMKRSCFDDTNLGPDPISRAVVNKKDYRVFLRCFGFRVEVQISRFTVGGLWLWSYRLQRLEDTET